MDLEKASAQHKKARVRTAEVSARQSHGDTVVEQLSQHELLLERFEDLASRVRSLPDNSSETIVHPHWFPASENIHSFGHATSFGDKEPTLQLNVFFAQDRVASAGVTTTTEKAIAIEAVWSHSDSRLDVWEENNPYDFDEPYPWDAKVPAPLAVERVDLTDIYDQDTQATIKKLRLIASSIAEAEHVFAEQIFDAVLDERSFHSLDGPRMIFATHTLSEIPVGTSPLGDVPLEVRKAIVGVELAVRELSSHTTAFDRRDREQAVITTADMIAGLLAAGKPKVAQWFALDANKRSTPPHEDFRWRFSLTDGEFKKLPERAINNHLFSTEFYDQKLVDAGRNPLRAWDKWWDNAATKNEDPSDAEPPAVGYIMTNREVPAGLLRVLNSAGLTDDVDLDSPGILHSALDLVGDVPSELDR